MVIFWKNTLDVNGRNFVLSRGATLEYFVGYRSYTPFFSSYHSLASLLLYVHNGSSRCFVTQICAPPWGGEGGGGSKSRRMSRPRRSVRPKLAIRSKRRMRVRSVGSGRRRNPRKRGGGNHVLALVSQDNALTNLKDSLFYNTLSTKYTECASVLNELTTAQLPAKILNALTQNPEKWKISTPSDDTTIHIIRCVHEMGNSEWNSLKEGLWTVLEKNTAAPPNITTIKVDGLTVNFYSGLNEFQSIELFEKHIALSLSLNDAQSVLDAGNEELVRQQLAKALGVNLSAT